MPPSCWLSCERIAILAGQGARGAGEELEQVAEKLGAPVAKASLGKDCIPDDSPYTTGGIGVIGTRPDPGGDGVLRRTADRREHDALHRVLPVARAGQVRPDRRQAGADRSALSRRRCIGRRRPGNPAGFPAAPLAQGGPVVPIDGARGDERVVGSARAPCSARGRTVHEAPDRRLGAVQGAR